MMPRPKMVECDRLPPEKIDMNWATLPKALLCCWAELKSLASSSWFTPGTGITCPMRNTTSIPRVKRILLRSSGILKTFTNVWNIEGPFVTWAGSGTWTGGKGRHGGGESRELDGKGARIQKQRRRGLAPRRRNNQTGPTQAFLGASPLGPPPFAASASSA